MADSKETNNKKKFIFFIFFFLTIILVLFYTKLYLGKETHSLIINYNNGMSQNEIVVSIVEGNSYEIEVPTREGYRFKGWKINNTTSKFENDNVLQMGNKDTEITAEWDKLYKLEINLDGGETTQNLLNELVENETISLTIPSKEGYVFENWELEETTSKIENNQFIMGNEDTKITATWTPTEYEITYNLDGGNSTNKSNYNIETESFELEIPVKKGYKFLGWTGSNGDILTKNVIIEKGTTGNKEYKANWLLETYQIKYELNGGILEDSITSYTVHSESFKLENPTRKDYIFLGWTGSNGLIINKNILIKKGTAGNKIYYANWKEIEYQIEYVLYGGILDNKMDTYTASTDTFDLPIPKKDGYKFLGWYLNEKYLGEAETKILKGTRENKKYYAKWEPISYKINYELNNGEFKEEVKTSYTIESDNIELVSPIKENYIFIGWIGSNGAIANKNVIIKNGSIGNKNYKAIWIPEEYQIEYELNGGSIANKIENYNIETSTFDLPIPNREGYTFMGWYDNFELTGQNQTNIEKGTIGNKKYYAKWEPIVYTITYNLNNGIQGNNAKIEYTIETDSFSLPIPTKENHSFKGWYTNTELTGVVHTKIEKGTIGNREYYAKWQEYKDYSGYNIYDVLKDGAVIDNEKSLFVDNSKGINFKEEASLSNGYGKYMISSTANDKYPIYYYRGPVENNNIIFADICWKMVRTTETGGVKLIYNGIAKNGTCANETSETQLATKIKYNSTYNRLESFGYSYGNSHSLKYTTDSKVENGTIFANDVSYVDGNYILNNDRYIKDDNFTTTKEHDLQTHHYTCLKASTDSCEQVYFIYMSRGTVIHYIILENGETIEEVLSKEFSNSSNLNNSTIKTYVENWFSKELTSYQTYLEDTVWCNDRSIFSKGGWDKNGLVTEKLTFNANARISIEGKPSVVCENKSDMFTINEENGNGALKYPIGLLTLDEVSLSGMVWNKDSTSSYLYNEKLWWVMSPSLLSANLVYIGLVHSMLDNVHSGYISNDAGGVRPAISLKYDLKIKEGNGTSNNPLIVEMPK